MQHRPAFLALALLLISASAAARERFYQGRLVVTAEPRSEGEVGAIWDLAEDVLEPHDPALVRHRLVVTPETLRLLRERDIPLRVEERDAQRWLDGLQRTDELGPVLFQAGKLGIFGSFFTTVPNLDAIHAHLDELAADSGGRAAVVVLGTSVEGRPIKAMRISTATGPSERASIVVVGAQHAREWASPVVAMGLIDGLVRQYPADPRVKRLLDNVDVIINPVNNPDGYVATFNGRRLQRKNLNAECNVDLNRNYETAWGTGTSAAGCTAGNYPGKSALSEPESQAIERLVQSLHRPALLIDYHSTAAQVMIPYAYTMARPPGYEKNREWCELYSSTLRELNGTSYPARPGIILGRGQGGSAFDWFRERFAETIVVELGGGDGFNIADSQIVPFAEENYLAFLAVALRVADENPTDGAPIPPDASAPPPDAPTSPPAVTRVDATVPSDAETGANPADAGISTPPDDEEPGCQCSLNGRQDSRQGPLHGLLAGALTAVYLLRRARSQNRFNRSQPSSRAQKI